MGISALKLFYFFLLASGKIRNGDSISKVEDHVILKRQIDLLPGGSVTHVKSRRSTPQPHCLQNEYGPNCTYCVPSDTCEDGHFTCDSSNGDKICLQGYHGDSCKLSAQVTIQYHVTCPENTCRNGGTCSSGQCCCRTGFTGILCEIEIIECTNQSCSNGGICKDLIGKFECLCKPSFHGKNCELPLDHTGTTPSRDSSCHSNSCKNNGTCLEDTFLTYCLCPTYYSGETCETRLGKPTGLPNVCPDDYFGDGCKIYCKPQDTCSGHFVCDEITGDKICISGWHGLNCDTRIVPQSVDPLCPKHGCKNDGQCFNRGCCCRNNYTGDYCQVESIGCLSGPCTNNATCVPQGNGFVCLCQSNFTGKMCESNIIPSTVGANTIYSTNFHSTAFTVSPSAVTNVIQGNPLPISILPSSSHIAVSSDTLVESLQSKQMSLTHVTNTYTDISNSESYHSLLHSESQLPISKIVHSSSVTLMTPSYSSSVTLMTPAFSSSVTPVTPAYSSTHLEASSSTHSAAFPKATTLPRTSVNLGLRSSHHLVHTTSSSSLTFSDSFVTPSSLFYPIIYSTGSSTLQVTSSSEYSHLSTLSIHYAHVNRTTYTLASTGLQSNTISLSSSQEYSSSIDSTILKSFSSSVDPLLIYPSKSSNKVNIIVAQTETHQFSDFPYNSVSKSPSIDAVDKSNATALASSSSTQTNEITPKYPTKTYAVSSLSLTSSMPLSSLSGYPTYVLTDTLKGSDLHGSLSENNLLSSKSDLSISTSDSLSHSYFLLAISSSSYSNHSPSSLLSTSPTSSQWIQTTPKISSVVKTKVISPAHQSNNKITNSFTTTPSSTGSSAVSNTQLQTLQPTTVRLSSVLSSSDMVTTIHKLESSDKTILIQPTSPLTAKTIMSKLNDSTYRPNSNGLQPSFTRGISSSTNTVTRIVPTKIYVSSIDSVFPSTSTLVSHNPTYLSNAASIQTAQPKSSVLLLNSDKHITHTSDSLYIKPTKTLAELRSSDELSRTAINGMNTVTQSTHTDYSSRTVVITDLSYNPEDGEGLSKSWQIALIVIACVLLLVAVVFLVVFLTVRQRRKDSRTISHSPADIHDYSKEHFSEQPDFNNPTYDVDNDSDGDSIKYDIYVVNE